MERLKFCARTWLGFLVTISILDVLTVYCSYEVDGKFGYYIVSSLTGLFYAIHKMEDK